MHLPAISLDKRFVLVSLDAGLWLPELLRGKNSNANDLEKNIPLLRLVLAEAMTTLSPELTGVEVGPVVGFDSLTRKSFQSGCLISLDRRNQEVDPLSLPLFAPDWGVEHIRNNYGVVSLRLAYHPSEKLANDKQKLVAEVADHCRYEGVDLFLEIILTPSADAKKGTPLWQEAQLVAANEMGRLVNLLALEYPGDALSCATLTAQLDIPWILLDSGVGYSKLKEQLRVVLEGGGRGMMMQNSIWDGLPTTSGDELDDRLVGFIKNELRDRVMEMKRIIIESPSLA